MLGKHTVKHWSSTQASIALSSGEAEFAGVIRGSGQGLGYQALLSDLGVSVPLRVWTDSSAAIGICTRQGLGKLRHLDTHTLWIQQAVRTGCVDLRKIPGEANPADLLTKHSISRQRMQELVSLFGCRYLDGRAASAPQVKKGESGRTTMADADRTIAAAHEHDGGTPPIMPHVQCSAAELQDRYPPLEAPEDDKLDDLRDDADDQLLNYGKGVASAVRAQTLQHGRTRKLPASVVSAPGAAPASTPGRRRSGNGRCLTTVANTTSAAPTSRSTSRSPRPGTLSPSFFCSTRAGPTRACSLDGPPRAQAFLPCVHP